MTKPAPPPLAAVIAAFAVVYLVWGSTYLAIRYAVETIPPFMMAGIRFVLAGWAMYAYLWVKGAALMTNRQWLASGVAGTFMLVGGNGLVCWAEQMIPSGAAALIIGTSPLWIVGFEWLFFGGVRPTFALVVGLILGLIGVAILAGPSNLVGKSIDPLGAVAALLACVFWAWGSMSTRSAAMPRSALLSVTAQMMVGGTVLLLVSLAIGEPSRFDPSHVTAKSLGSLAYLIVFGAILAFSCYNWLFRVCKPAHVSTYAYVNPVVAVFLGYWFADEPLGPRTLVAAALILAGVFLVTARKKRQPTAEMTEEVANEQRQPEMVGSK